SVQLQDEYFLVVAMQIETVQRTPSCVDVDLGAAAEERLERLGEVRERRVQLVDRIEGQRRAAPKMIGHVLGAYARREPVEIRVGRRFEVAALTRQPE